MKKIGILAGLAAMLLSSGAMALSAKPTGPKGPWCKPPYCTTGPTVPVPPTKPGPLHLLPR